jgi:predicted aldo/keto reductase-like oxidoreductase
MAGEEFTGLTMDEKKRFEAHLDENYCRDCGLCLPCPKNLNIAAILRFHTLYTAYGLKNWAKKLYRGLEVGADNCSKCRECEPKCPYKLSIVEMLQRAQVDLEG